MAVAPPPTAEATRLTEPWRMSPAANTPGRLVSSSSGARLGVRHLPVASAASCSAVVGPRQPPASRSGPRPGVAPVAGSATTRRLSARRVRRVALDVVVVR